MLIDLNDFEHKTLNYDVCIIGSGIAGSIISKELSIGSSQTLITSIKLTFAPDSRFLVLSILRIHIKYKIITGWAVVEHSQ